MNSIPAVWYPKTRHPLVVVLSTLHSKPRNARWLGDVNQQPLSSIINTWGPRPCQSSLPGDVKTCSFRAMVSVPARWSTETSIRDTAVLDSKSQPSRHWWGTSGHVRWLWCKKSVISVQTYGSRYMSKILFVNSVLEFKLMKQKQQGMKLTLIKH